MKKILLCVLAIVCLIDLNAQTKPADGDGSKENPFKISTADELLWFSGYVDGDYTESANTEACAMLVADIRMDSLKSEWSPIGSKSSYAGVFDGDNHEIFSLNCVSKNNVGLFAKINNAVVKNIYLYGDTLKSTGSSSYAGGICGRAENSEIINCYNHIDIIGYGAGGICGYAKATTITGCINRGDIYGNAYAGGICAMMSNSNITKSFNITDIHVDSKSGGGIVGYATDNSTILYSANSGPVLPSGTDATLGGFCGTLENSKIDVSYNAGYVPYIEKKTGAFVGLYKSSAVTTNNCVTYAIPTQRSTHILASAGNKPRTTCVRYTNMNPFFTGEACVALNNGLDKPIWAQNLELSQFPYLAEEEDDYFVKIDTLYLQCPDAKTPYMTMYENYKYGDSLSIDTVIMNPDHIDEDGNNKCDVCLLYMPSYMKKYENSPFEIASAEDMVLFKDIVENGYPAIDAVLTDDIDMSSVCSEEKGSWKSIMKEYQGTFDGKGHVISNLYSCPDNYNTTGPLFYAITDTVKNVTFFKTKTTLTNAFGAPLVIMNKGVVVNCVSDSMEAIDRGCGLLVNNYGIVEKCIVKDMSVGENGQGFAETNHGEIRNCCYIGDSVTANLFSGIVKLNQEPVKNCFVYCNMSADEIFAITGYGLYEAYNCYTLPASTNTKYYKSDTLVYTPKEDFASGAVCMKLNEEQDSTVWYQTLGVDPYPVLDPTHGIVLYDENLGFYNKTEESTDSNDNEDDKPSFSVGVYGREIIVSGVGRFLIFDMAGKDVTSKNGELNNGIYIVCFNGMALKVVVQR